MGIYQPSDDSHVFADFLKKYITKIQHSKSNIQFLDIGTGSGILAKIASEFMSPKNITATDINQTALRALQKEKFQTIESNLFENIKGKFDLITFNAPYLPRDEREPKESQLATTGGERGYEISLRFLKQAKSHLNKNGKILLLISSLTPTNKIEKLWPYNIVARKKLFMEELQILEFI